MNDSVSDRAPEWTSKDPRANGGKIILILAWIFFAAALFVELSYFFAMRSDPIFKPWSTTMSSGISISAGWSQVMHIVAFLPFGIVMIFAALIRRQAMKTGRFKKSMILLVAGILLFPGTLSVALASVLGPDAVAREGQQNAVDSKITMDQIHAEGVPKVFANIDEYWPGEPDTTWRTGALYLDEPQISETCATAIDYAASKGATQVQELPSGPVTKIADREAAIASCVATMESYPKQAKHRFEVISPQFAMNGIAQAQPNSPISFILCLIKNGYEAERPYTWGYEFLIATTYAAQ